MRTSSWGRATGVLFGAVAVAVAVATPAAAHTRLQSSDPQAGARMTVAPQQVTLRFSESLRAGVTRVVVNGPGGTHVESGPPRATSPTTVVQPLRALETAGDYQIVYRVVASDGHSTSGSIPFTLTRAAQGGTAGPSATTPGRSGDGSSTGTAAGGGGSGSSGTPTWVYGLGGGLVLVAGGGAVWFARRATHEPE